METIKKSEYLAFITLDEKEGAKQPKKTKTIQIINIHHNNEIGIIKWFSAWRQYCFYPSLNTIWNTTCLNDVNSVIKQLMDERKKSNLKIKTIGVITDTIHNFQNWGKENGHNLKMGVKLGTQNSPHTRYIYITRAMDAYGYDFDEIIILDKAYLNPNYGGIVEHLNNTRVNKIYANEEHGIVSIMDAEVLNKKILPSENDFYFKD